MQSLNFFNSSKNIFRKGNNHIDLRIYFSEEFIPSVLNKYPEIFWLLDNEEFATSELANSKINLGWIHLLNLQSFKHDINSINILKKNHIEFERTITSLVNYKCFLEGNMLEYIYLIQPQKKNQHQLTYASYISLHNLTKEIIKNDLWHEAIISIIVYSDLSKSLILREKVNDQLRKVTDHDEFMHQLFQLPEKEIIKILPSYEKINSLSKNIIKNYFLAKNIHFGHLFHLESNPQFFNKTLQTFQSQINPSVFLNLSLIIHLTDVSGAAGHVQPFGSLTLTENIFQSYFYLRNLFYSYLSKNYLNSNELYFKYLKFRGKKLGLTTKNETNQTLIRLACMLRIFDKEKTKNLQAAFNKLPLESQNLLLNTFKTDGMLNKLPKTVTYFPALLLNLFNQESSDNVYYQVLEGASCVSKLLTDKRFLNKITRLKQPLSLNKLAKEVAEDKNILSSEHCHINQFIIINNELRNRII